MKAILKTMLLSTLVASVGAMQQRVFAEGAPPDSPQSSAATNDSGRDAPDELHVIKIQAYRVFTSQILTPKELINTSQPAESVPLSMIQLFGPQAGGTPALGILPNVSVSGYNNYSQVGRSQVSIRGLKVGYNSEPGDLTSNAITVELDGVPLNGLGQGTTWRSPEDPMGALMAGLNVIIGPGNPSERWYDSLGGTIDFIPVQPTGRPGGTLQLAGGSYKSNDVSAVYNTGDVGGWSTVIGGASARADSFRTTQYALPTNNEEAYIKTRHQFSDGSISFGGYLNHDYEWRPNWIPVAPQPLLDNAGLGIGTPYSEQTSGFYATMPRPLWHKTVMVQSYLLWSHMHLELSKTLKLSNMAWVRIGKDTHDKTELYAQNPSSPYYNGNPQNLEHYEIHSHSFGDRLAMRERFNRMDTLIWGGYFVSEVAEDDSSPSSTFEGYGWAVPLQVQFKTISSFYWSAFAQDDFRPVRRLKIVPGIRLEQFLTSYSNMSYTQACADYATINNGSCPVPGNDYTVNGNTFQFQKYDTSPDELTNYLRFEPSIGANYLLGHGVHLFANYASTYKAPNAQNRLDETHLEVQTLKPVRSEEYDLGVRYAALRLGIMREVYASLDVFHMLLSNETLTYSTAQNPLVTYFGYGSAVYKGVDLSLRAAFGRHLMGFFNFGYLKDRWNEFASPVSPSGPQPTGYGLPVSNSPKDTLSAGISYFISVPVLRAVHATLWDQYVGSRYLFSNEIGMPTNVTNPAYDLVNISISARLPVIAGFRHSVFSVQVLNLTNREYNSMEYISAGGDFSTPTGGYILAFPGAPRMVFASLTTDF